MIEQENPDAIILATGARPLVPAIKGIDKENVVNAEDVLWKNVFKSWGISLFARRGWL